ncbi:hypothetical protein GF351_06640 [Candidatus Woesearchaeota archaeon]|nr:hypothetical protein [Candidatus Woesearchaeota archaeon]
MRPKEMFYRLEELLIRDTDRNSISSYSREIVDKAGYRRPYPLYRLSRPKIALWLSAAALATGMAVYVLHSRKGSTDEQVSPGEYISAKAVPELQKRGSEKHEEAGTCNDVCSDSGGVENAEPLYDIQVATQFIRRNALDVMSKINGKTVAGNKLECRIETVPREGKFFREKHEVVIYAGLPREEAQALGKQITGSIDGIDDYFPRDITKRIRDAPNDKRQPSQYRHDARQRFIDEMTGHIVRTSAEYILETRGMEHVGKYAIPEQTARDYASAMHKVLELIPDVKYDLFDVLAHESKFTDFRDDEKHPMGPSVGAGKVLRGTIPFVYSMLLEDGLEMPEGCRRYDTSGEGWRVIRSAWKSRDLGPFPEDIPVVEGDPFLELLFSARYLKYCMDNTATREDAIKAYNAGLQGAAGNDRYLHMVRKNHDDRVQKTLQASL